jgi:hypothetical protein
LTIAATLPVPLRGVVVGAVGSARAGTPGATVAAVVVARAGDGPVVDVVVDWTVAAGRLAFHARTAGVLDTRDNRLQSAGRITDGWLRGGRVRADGDFDAAVLAAVAPARLALRPAEHEAAPPARAPSGGAWPAPAALARRAAAVLYRQRRPRSPVAEELPVPVFLPAETP